jgi:hypothetical protein
MFMAFTIRSAVPESFCLVSVSARSLPILPSTLHPRDIGYDLNPVEYGPIKL